MALRGDVIRVVVVVGLALASLAAAALLPVDESRSGAAVVAGAAGLIALAVGYELDRTVPMAVIAGICAVGVLFPFSDGSIHIWALVVVAVGFVLAYLSPDVPIAVGSLGSLALAGALAAPGNEVVSGLMLAAGVHVLLLDGREEIDPIGESEISARSDANSTQHENIDGRSHPDTMTGTGGVQLGERPRGAGLITAVPSSLPPYTPSRISDEYQIGSLAVLGHSRRGVAHVDGLEPRQDDYALATSVDGRWLVVAVCDGVGSVKTSHIGSYWATRVAVDVVSKGLANQDPAGEFFAEAFRTIATRMTWAADKLANKSGDEIATTLVVAAIDTRTGIGQVARVGDSDAMMESGGEWKSVFNSTLVDVSTPTSVMPTDAAVVEVAALSVGTEECLIIGTDGVCDVIATSADVVGRRFGEDLASICTLDHFERLVGFERRGAFGDRTLIAIWGGMSL